MTNFSGFLKRLVLLTLFIGSQCVYAQIRSVIPANQIASISLNNKNSVPLSFEFSSITLPPDATVDSAKFDIVLNQVTDGTTSIIVTYDGNIPPGLKSNQINSRVLP